MEALPAVDEFRDQFGELAERFDFLVSHVDMTRPMQSGTQTLRDYVFGVFPHAMAWFVQIYSFTDDYLLTSESRAELKQTVDNYRRTFETAHAGFLRKLATKDASERLKAYFFGEYVLAISPRGGASAEPLRAHLQDTIDAAKREWERLLPKTKLQETVRSIVRRLVKAFGTLFDDLYEAEDVQAAARQVRLRSDAYKELYNAVRSVQVRQRYGDELQSPKAKRLR